MLSIIIIIMWCAVDICKSVHLYRLAGGNSNASITMGLLRLGYTIAAGGDLRSRDQQLRISPLNPTRVTAS